MRKPAKSLRLALCSLLGAIVLTASTVFFAAIAFGAIALIVPGTGTPNANIVENYKEQARDRYLKDTACGPTGAACPDANLIGIDYPASFWPLVIFPSWCRSGPDGCDKWDVSVGKGADALTGELEGYLTDTDEEVVIFGYSQGGAVVSKVLSDYIAGLSDEEKARIKIVTIGGIETPDGGLWTRLGFLPHIPIFDITFPPAMKPDTGVNYISYAFHYDPVADAPRYWGNPFAMINAIAALETVHGYYLSPNGNGPDDTLPYGYTDETLAPHLVCDGNPNCRTDDYGNQYIVIPATSLPIADLVYSLTPAALRPVVKPFIELVAPAWRVLAELGYDYSGDPSVSTPLSILPFNPFTFNPVKFAIDMVGAIVQGVVNATGGGTSLSPLNPPETTSTTTGLEAFSRLAVEQRTPQTIEQDPLPERGSPDGTVSTLGAQLDGDGTPAVVTDADAAAKAAAEAAAKEAAEQAAAEAAAKEAKEKAEKEAAEQAAKEKAEKEAAEQAKITEAADKARETAAENARDAAGVDNPSDPGAPGAVDPEPATDEGGDAASADQEAA